MMFLAFGSFWFFVLAAAACLLLVYSVETDKWGWGALTIAGTFLLLGVFGGFNILSFVWDNPGQSAVWVGGYIVAGALWSVAKWFFYVLGRKIQYNEHRVKFLESLSLGPKDEIPEDEKGHFRASMEGYGTPNHDGEPLYERPKASNHKSRITTWVAYWPWSILWTLIGDIFKRMAHWVYEGLHGLYEKISSHLYKDVSKDMPDTLLQKHKKLAANSD